MPYRFATQQMDYSDLASGQVFYSLPGHPAFPIRLASEIFQRCLAQRAGVDNTERMILYDPCCGTAYHLSTLVYGHWPALQEVIGSDIDSEAVVWARRNLALLTPEGLEQRIQELAGKYDLYGKASFQAAIQSAGRLRDQVVSLAQQHPMKTRVFQASALDAEQLRLHLSGTRVDIVLTDIPYGQQSAWQVETLDPTLNPAEQMLEALHPILHAESIVAVASDKQQKVRHDKYKRMERFQVGKRQVVLLKPLL